MEHSRRSNARKSSTRQINNAQSGQSRDYTELAQALENAESRISDILQTQADIQSQEIQARSNAASESQRREYIDQQLRNVSLELRTLVETNLATLKEQIITMLNQNRELHRQEYLELSPQFGGARAELNNMLRTESTTLRQEIQSMLNLNGDAHSQEYAELAQQVENARVEVHNSLRMDNAALRQEMQTTLERNSQSQRQECSELARQLEATQLTLARDILEATNTIAILKARVLSNETNNRALEERMAKIERDGKSFVFKEHSGDIVVCNTYKSPEKKKSKCCIS